MITKNENFSTMKIKLRKGLENDLRQDGRIHTGSSRVLQGGGGGGGGSGDLKLGAYKLALLCTGM